MRGTLTIGKQLLQGFWESRKIALWVKCHREGSKWFHGTTSLSRVSPASNFGCWSWRKVPQDFKIQWVTAPFPSWSTKKRATLWWSIPVPSDESHGPAPSMGEAPSSWQPCSNQQEELVSTSALSWIRDGKYGSPPDRQAGLSGLGFGCRQGFLVSIIKCYELHYSQQRSTEQP